MRLGPVHHSACMSDPVLIVEVIPVIYSSINYKPHDINTLNYTLNLFCN